MAFNKLPRFFFGDDYTVITGNLTLGTVTKTTGATAATFSADPVANVITTLAAHTLKVGDPVRFSGGAVGGLSAATTYYILTVPDDTSLTVTATLGGAELTLTTVASLATISVLGLLRDVTDAEAEPETTGDWRKVVAGTMEMLHRRWTSVPIVDRPTKLTITRATSVSPALGVVLTYTIRVVSAPAPLEVAEE